MDLFGKQARQELEQLREKMNVLEFRYRDVVAKYSAIMEELRENKTLVDTINAAKKSKAVHADEKRDHDQKAAEYARKSKDIAAKEAELLAMHEYKKAALTKEKQALENNLSAIKAELADFQKRAKTLEQEIQSDENKRDSARAEFDKLKTNTAEVEAALKMSQEKQSELTGAVDKLTRQREALACSNLYLNQVTSHLNRIGDEDMVFASLEHDLHRFLTHDRTSGAMQVTLKARQLLLVVDFGCDTLNLAAVRAGLLCGGSEISLVVESRKIAKNICGSRIETVFAAWLWERFTVVHPRLKKSVKDQKGVELCLPGSQRLLSLLCQGAPHGVVEEMVVIDSEPFSASIPLLRENLVSVFLPLLGPDGELIGAIRRFLAEYKLSVDAIDRVVCMGWYGRLPLVRESLGEVFKRPVLVAEQLGTVAGVAEARVMPVKPESKAVGRICVVVSDPEREKREKAEKAEKERLEKLERDRHAKLEKERKDAEERKMQAVGFTCPVSRIEFVFVKGGAFKMGDSFSDGDDDEKPVHEVSLDSFLIGKYPVTQRQWQAVMGTNPSEFKTSGLDAPVENVSWYDVQEFIKKLNIKSCKSYRLPTEAEWEYAARSGGKNEKWAGTSDESSLASYAWYDKNSGDCTHPVGQKKPNWLGLYDMSGNVKEWVGDWYGRYSTDCQQNPRGPSSGTFRVDRGGGWGYCQGFVRAAIRGGDLPDLRSYNLGVRLLAPQGSVR